MKKMKRLIIAALLLTGIAPPSLFAEDNPEEQELATTAMAKESRKPNVIIIFTDDQGYQDLGVFGSPNIKTPNIDQMAKEGMLFTDFYSAASVCTPSRAALLTGCYPERVGDLGVLFPKDAKGLNPKETTIAGMLKNNGYATACIGKWHLGHLTEFLPTSHGFNSYYGIPYSNDMVIAQNMKLSADLKLREGVTRETMWEPKKNWVPLMRDEEVVEYPADQSTLTKRYTEEAINFITSNSDKPFFLYLPHTMPHDPLYASPKFEGKSEAGLYGDCIEEIDWSVGEIIKTLKSQGIDKDTLIIYTSDNGPWYMKENATDKVKGNKNRRVGGSALPLRGHKFREWEGGMRVPTVMWWPGRIPAGKVCTEIAGTIDLLPTIAAISGAALPSEKLDGKSILPLLEGQPGATSPHAAYFYRTNGVRVRNWKLIDGQLFDLSKDISERNCLAGDNPEIVERLGKLLSEHKQELDENKRPFGMVAK
jgi:arylsulfatase A-like enzyme